MSIAQDLKHVDSSVNSVDFEAKKLAAVLEKLNLIYNVEIRLDGDKWNQDLVSFRVERADIHTAIRVMLRGYNYSLRREGQRQWLLTVYGLAGNYDHRTKSRAATNERPDHKVVGDSNLQDDWIEIKGGFFEGIREFIRNPVAQQRGSEGELTLETQTETPADEWIEREGPDGIREFVRIPNSVLRNDLQAKESSIANRKNRYNWIELEGPDGIKEVIRRTVVKDTY